MRLYCTDGYEAYTGLIPLGRLYQGKDQTHGIERTHGRQRHWLARFRLSTAAEYWSARRSKNPSLEECAPAPSRRGSSPLTRQAGA